MNVLNDYQNLSVDEIKELYAKISSDVAVGCINLSGDCNIGMMIRSSSIFGVGKFYILGRKFYDRRSSVGTQNHIPVVKIYTMLGNHSETLNINEVINELKKLQDTYTIVFIEQSEKSIQLSDIHTIKMDKPPLFIFGNESSGIPIEILNMELTICIEIKQRGIGRSLNVSTACGIVLYEWFR